MAGPDPIRLIVNGQVRDVRLPPDTPLLSVLRNDLGLLGSRPGCQMGRCGACTVHIDGRAVQSCTTPLWSAADRIVITVETERGTIARVRAAFLDEQAAQCGYCVNGIMMTVAALLDGPKRDRAEVLHILDERHLCRCGAHPRMLRAIDRLFGGAA